MRLSTVGIVVVGLFGGCKAVVPPADVEGANPGECEDGADNDVDGYYDCDDNNCWGAPICKDGTGGTGGGNDTDDGGGLDDTDPAGVTGTGFADHLKSFSMTYLVTFEFDSFGALICDNYFHVDNCNCSAVYTGHGQLVEADGARNTYAGEWKVESTNCLILDDGRPQTTDVNFNDGSIWRPTRTTEAYHTFHFKSDLTKMLDWITHADLAATTRVTTDIMAAEQYWVKATEPHELDPETLLMPYHEQETKFVDLIAVINVSDFQFAFSEDTTEPVLTLPELVIP